MWLYCHLVALCCYVIVFLKALKKEKKETNCVQVFYLKNNKVKTVQVYFLFFTLTFEYIIMWVKLNKMF